MFGKSLTKNFFLLKAYLICCIDFSLLVVFPCLVFFYLVFFLPFSVGNFFIYICILPKDCKFLPQLITLVLIFVYLRLLKRSFFWDFESPPNNAFHSTSHTFAQSHNFAYLTPVASFAQQRGPPRTPTGPAGIALCQ